MKCLSVVKCSGILTRVNIRDYFLTERHSFSRWPGKTAEVTVVALILPLPSVNRRAFGTRISFSCLIKGESRRSGLPRFEKQQQPEPRRAIVPLCPGGAPWFLFSDRLRVEGPC